jgi:hypothetical protein
VALGCANHVAFIDVAQERSRISSWPASVWRHARQGRSALRRQRLSDDAVVDVARPVDQERPGHRVPYGLVVVE